MSLSESLALKAVSLLLALILWISILGFTREEIRISVKLEPQLPPGMVLVSKVPSHIQFTLSGSRLSLKQVEKRIQGPIRPNLRRNGETSYTVAFDEGFLGELQGVRIVSIIPSSIEVRLEEMVERLVPVKPTLKGEPPQGYSVHTVRSTPAKVAVAGAKSLVATLDVVGTEEIDISEVKGLKETTVSVDVDTTLGFQLTKDKTVGVTVTTRKK